MNGFLKNDDWINSFYTVNGITYRSYDNNIYTFEQIFINEMGFFFKKLLEEHNLELYYIKCEPKHKIVLLKNDLNFFKTFKENLNIPENIEILRNMQYKDLLKFYKNYIFNGVEAFFIISKMQGDLYYYDLLLAVKKDFNLQKFAKIDFKLINFKSFNKLSLKDLNFNYIQNIFDFKELESYFFREILENECERMVDKAKKLSEYELFKLEVYRLYCYNNDIDINTDPMYAWYSNETLGKFDESIDDLIMFRSSSKNFGWLFFILSHEFRDLETFYRSELTYNDFGCFVKVRDSKQTILIGDDDILASYKEEYVYFSFVNIFYHLVYNCNKNYCIVLHNIYTKKIEYGTTYKQRLWLFENKKNRKN